MMNKIILCLKHLLIVMVLIVQLQATAAIKLPALIGNNMVLQQNSIINVWGWADVGETITVRASWQTDSLVAITDSAGNWFTTIKTPVAGGPYTMMLSGRDDTISIENIMMGEVWVCSGQSNMEFTMRGLGGWCNYKPEIRDEVSKGDFSDVRLFTLQKDTSALPLTDCKGNWLTADTATVNDFSATAWFFGSELNRKLGVPIGLIVAAWGGTPAEVWTPVESIRAEAGLGFYLSHFNGSEWWPGTPGVLYNAMIHPLLNYTIKGAIWYQGESNRLDANLYPALMNTMITSWRKNWGLGDFPFYFVQIAPYSDSEAFSGALLREAQLKCLSIPNTGMAVTLDIAGDITDVHPKNKLDVGKRLALWALNKTYGEQTGCFSGPVFQEMKITGNAIVLSFQYTDGGLKLRHTKQNNFIIAGEDRVFYPAKVNIEGSSLIISSPHVKKPVAVRYAFTNTSEATLFNGAGLPASSFHTDNWDIITGQAVLSAVFDTAIKTLTYQLSSNARETDIFYDFDKQAGHNGCRYQHPIAVKKPCFLYATLARDGYFSGQWSRWKIITNKAAGSKITYQSAFSERYTGGGHIALVDGITASENFADGSWQGFEGNDLDIVIDLGRVIKVKEVSCNFLSDNHAWIFLPGMVTAEVSEDGSAFRKIGENDIRAGKEMEAVSIRKLIFRVKGNIRFIHIKAKNQGVCPSWHPGAGEKSWLFVDEIVVK
ncbi:MAG: hypothetical protein HOO86_04670 [Bacteroidales bacterium]|nr:hypothetical protein [Bacteroidales bacterium]